MFFKDWELKMLEYLWGIKPAGSNSRDVLDNVLQSMGESISRTSVINFLQNMSEKGVCWTRTTEQAKADTGTSTRWA